MPGRRFDTVGLLSEAYDRGVGRRPLSFFSSRVMFWNGFSHLFGFFFFLPVHIVDSGLKRRVRLFGGYRYFRMLSFEFSSQ